jgi:hypothetical protein
MSMKRAGTLRALGLTMSLLLGACAGKRLNTVGETEAARCTDQAKNGSETDIDCGGPDCAVCPVEATCATHEDCESGVCKAGICRPADCGDGVRNGAESDVDCGGACVSCVEGMRCIVPSDCSNGACGTGVCMPAACDDSAPNGDETDIDCGGSCSACDPGKACKVSSDCNSGRCDGGVCASCSDGLMNGPETDVDCGGGVCPGCIVKGLCEAASDCESGVCGEPNFGPNRCYPPECGNGLRDGNETDVDCGGDSCPGCEFGDVCAVETDCKYGDCLDGTCSQPCTTTEHCSFEHVKACEAGKCLYCHSSDDCSADICGALSCSCKNGYFMCK